MRVAVVAIEHAEVEANDHELLPGSIVEFAADTFALFFLRAQQVGESSAMRTSRSRRVSLKRAFSMARADRSAMAVSNSFSVGSQS